METKTADSVIPDDVQADTQLIADCLASGTLVPAEVKQRVRARADKVRQEILRQHGVQDIGVQIIRELRGELPDA